MAQTKNQVQLQSIAYNNAHDSTHGRYISIIANFAKAIRVSESLESLRQWLAALAAS